MSIGNLYLSTILYDWSENKDNKIFLDSNNLSKIISDSKSYDCYTTIEDIGFYNTTKLINNAQNIVLVDINKQTLAEIPESSVHGYFNVIKLARQKISSNLDFLDDIFNDINARSSERKVDDLTLWTVGCSLTAGIGVDESQRYGYVLSKLLNLPETVLARPGASISWAADQILRADIKKDDTVIWGLTNLSRIDYNHGFDLISAPIDKYVKLDKRKQFWNIDYFDSLSLTISNFKQILQVINFCDKVGARLYLVNLLDQGLVSLLLIRLSNFIDLSGIEKFDSQLGRSTFIDIGNDNNHPGPKQHRLYAEEIYNFIKQNETNRP